MYGIQKGIVNIAGLGSATIQLPCGGILIIGQVYVGAAIYNVGVPGCEKIGGYAYSFDMIFTSSYKLTITRTNAGSESPYYYFFIKTKQT